MLLTVGIVVPSVLAAVIGAIYFLILCPPREPANIPAVPFWLTLLPLFRDVDQIETYKKYLEPRFREYGAVKIFFGGQWNILVGRPEFVAHLFKDEDLFRKSGNFEKIPHSLFSRFLGNNIISAHGDDWRLYRKVITPALQQSYDAAPVERNTRRLGDLIVAAQDAAGHGRAIPVQELLQNFTIENTANMLLETDFGSLEPGQNHLSRQQTQLKRHLFNPIFMNFPFLDRLPFPSRKRAWALVERFRESLLDGILRGGAAAVSADADRQSPTPKRDSAARHLLTARNDGRLTEAQFCENLTVLFTASQENPQLALLSTLYLLAKHRDVQATLYEQLTTTKASETPLERQPLLTAVILESLRLFPPISQLINRLTTAPALLTSMTSVATSKTGSLPAHESRTVIIPAGTYVGYSTVAANRSRIHWVADADEFRPERWWTTPTTITESYVEVRHFSSNSNEESNDGGDVATDTASVRLAAIASLQRRQRRLGAFASFHGGRRACAGERLAMLELRVAIAGLVMRFEFGFEEGCGEGQGIRMMPAGPLCPRDLRLVFREREGTK